MKVIATIAQANTANGPRAIAISPNDNIAFVALDDAPESMLKEASSLMPEDKGAVLGFVIELEVSK